MKQVAQFVELFGITEDEALRALLSAFASVQPGPMRQMLLQRYGEAPSTRDIWNLMVSSDFRCGRCNTHYDLTLDHIDSDTSNNQISNFRVLCRDCNRAINSRGVQNHLANLRLYKAALDIYARTGRFPTNNEACSHSKVSQVGGAMYMLKLLKFKLTEPKPTDPASTQHD